MKNDQQDDLGWKSLNEILTSPEFMEWIKSQGELNENIRLSASYYQKLIAIRKFYLTHEEAIIRTPLSWQSSYPCDWTQILTPIEFAAWAAIRAKGRIILYPQYPVLNYHLDFGNPGLKIGLEIDGKQYHNQEKDKIRDRHLKHNGWTIYRITGSEMMKTDFIDWGGLNDEEIEYESDKALLLKPWILETGDGVIEAIKQLHFLKHNGASFKTQLGALFISYCFETLEKHQLV